jgi:DNA-binding transcriptional MerR regulator
VVTDASHDRPDRLLTIGSVVAELRRSYPDVTHSSLRFLEREGLIAPIRTPGGHRLFRPGDVERIRQIKTWQAQRLSLDEIRQRLAALQGLEQSATLADHFLREALAGDFAAASQLILGADDLGMPLMRLFGDVLRPALQEVGTRWERGGLPVGQEKEVSELARDLISELSRRHADPDPHGPIVVAACVAGERHELGLRMVIGLLRERGWRVHFLGADVAPRFLVETVLLRGPAVVLLSATREERLPAVADALTAVREIGIPERVPIVVVGGRGVVAHSATLRDWGAIPAGADGLDAALEALSVAVRGGSGPLPER